ASGRVRPVTFVGTNVAVGYCRVLRTLCFTKLSRCDWSLVSELTSKEICDPGANVPSSFSWNDPLAPVATRTASDGKFRLASCSRTRTVAFDLSETVQVCAPAAMVALAAAVGVGVALGVAVASTATWPAPAQPPATSATIARTQQRVAARSRMRSSVG